MEQMGTFMAEYAEWFYMGSSLVMLVLLIYVLHRIKKSERKNLLMNGEIEKRLKQIEKQSGEKQTEKQAETENGEKQTEKQAETENREKQTEKQAETENREKQIEKESEERKGGQNAEPVTVIRDVIEEIFS